MVLCFSIENMYNILCALLTEGCIIQTQNVIQIT